MGRARHLVVPNLDALHVFKNLIVFRLLPEWQADPIAAEEALQAARFTPCGASQPSSAGFVEPRGDAHGPLLELVAGQWLLKLQTESKLLPSSVVKRRVDEIAAQIEQQTGRQPGKREKRDLKEQATLELLPQAFTRQGATRIWIDPKAGALIIDASSAKRAEDVITLLTKHLPGFGVRALQTALAPAAAMAAWLTEGAAPEPFHLERECELKAADELRATVRYTRHHLDIDEVREHISTGKQPTRLALGWRGRVNFVLTDTLQVKRVAFDDVVFESTKGSQTAPEESFDADAAIATGELAPLLAELIEALDGELDESAGPAVASSDPAPTPAVAAPKALAPADRKSTRLNSSHSQQSRMPSSA